MEGLTIRLATENDYESVMAIDEAVYGGIDYLPSMYNKMILHPDFSAVLAEMHGVVVGFAGAYIVNKGTTMQTMASRVRESQQGKGVYGKLWRYLTEIMKQKYPKMMYECFTTNDLNIRLKMKSFMELFQVTLTRPFTHYIMDFENVMIPTDTEHLCKQVSFDRLADLFTNKEECSKFFTESSLIVNWNPYEPIVENIEHMRTSHDTVMFGMYASGGELNTLSFGTYHEVPNEFRFVYILDIYVSSDYTDVTASNIQSHVAAHMCFAKQLGLPAMVLGVFTETKYHEISKQATIPLGITPKYVFASEMIGLRRRIK